MELVTFFIAVTGFVLSIYTFITNKLGKRPKLEIFRFEPERIVVDDDFDTLHIYTDADFIVTNLSDKPNTVIEFEAEINLGKEWIKGIARGTRLVESTRTRTDYGGADNIPQHHNEIVKEWVRADVCPIMLSPQASGIPNQGISLRLDFQNSGPIVDLSNLQLRLTLHDQYESRHDFTLGQSNFSKLTADRYPKFHENEEDLGGLKDNIPGENMAALVRVVYRKYESDLSQSILAVRRHYPSIGERRLKNVAHISRDGYAYNGFRSRDFMRKLEDAGDSVYELNTADGFTFSFSAKNGLPDQLIVKLPDSWAGKELKVAIPEDFAALCKANN
ncbi:MAG: hypothetical protein OXU24_10030 [Gammaproteobacteria bacterium]|nr:hypothetical protein [Gammaproteobacteria bacterium]